MSRSMTEPTYSSSRLYSIFIPASTCALGLLCVLGALSLLVTNGDWRGFLALGAMGGVLLFLFARSWRRFGLVTVSPAGITIRQQGADFRFAWRDVASFRTIPFVTPPIYRLTFHASDVVTYFVPVWSASLSLGFWTFHFSGMGRFIQGQLREIGAT